MLVVPMIIPAAEPLQADLNVIEDIGEQVPLGWEHKRRGYTYLAIISRFGEGGSSGD